MMNFLQSQSQTGSFAHSSTKTMDDKLRRAFVEQFLAFAQLSLQNICRLLRKSDDRVTNRCIRFESTVNKSQGRLWFPDAKYLERSLIVHVDIPVASSELEGLPLSQSMLRAQRQLVVFATCALLLGDGLI